MQCSNCGKKNKVVINGKAYCADCGQPLSQTKQPKKHSAHSGSKKHSQSIAQSAPKQQKKTHVLDLSKSTKTSASKPTRSAQSVHGVRKNQSPQIAKTNSVKSPAKPAIQVATKQNQRIDRAQKTRRSDKIQKFSGEILTKYETPTAITPYQPKSETQMNPHETYSIAVAEPKTPSKALEQHPAIEDITELHRESQQKRPSLMKRLAQAFAHPQFATIGAVAACFILLAGYISYLNYPKLAMRVATSKAGFDAQLPRYTPAGYGFSSKIASSPGQVVVRFDSHNDATSLALAQRQTSWDSATLLENYVKPRSNNYLTFQQNGLIIYIYNGNNAAWINSGVFYTLEGNSRLSNEQLIKVATSL